MQTWRNSLKYRVIPSGITDEELKDHERRMEDSSNAYDNAMFIVLVATLCGATAIGIYLIGVTPACLLLVLVLGFLALGLMMCARTDAISALCQEESISVPRALGWMTTVATIQRYRYRMGYRTSPMILLLTWIILAPLIIVFWFRVVALWALKSIHRRTTR